MYICTGFFLDFNYIENALSKASVCACVVFHGETTGEPGGKQSTIDGRIMGLSIFFPRRVGGGEIARGD